MSAKIKGKIKKTVQAVSPVPKDDKIVASSPVPAKKIVMLSFYDALRETIEGKRLTKVEWDDVNTYIFADADWLLIHRGDCEMKECKKGCKTHRLMISRGDMEGVDWYAVPEAN